MVKPKKPEVMWFVAGNFGLYYGSGHRTRQQAIDDHCHALGHNWTTLKAQGDYVARYEVRPLTPRKAKP